MIVEIYGTVASAAEPLRRGETVPYDLHQILSIIKEELCE